MDIKQFKYSKDNFGYLLFSGKEALAIDPGAVEDMMQFAFDKQIEIKMITNTHLHQDHTLGNKAMLERTQGRFLDCSKIKSLETIFLNQDKIDVFPTPGHTLDSVCFSAKDFLVTGDTLFNGTVGNCFSGDLDAFFLSLKELMAFPEDTRIYSGHDYVEESMTYARIIEKDNPFIDSYLKTYEPNHVVSRLKDEFKVNPYIRFNAPSIIGLLEQKEIFTSSELERFKAVMELY